MQITLIDISVVIMNFIQIILIIYLLLPSVLLFSYFLSRFFSPRCDIRNKNLKKNNFGIIITAHQDTRFIDPLVDSLLKQYYNNFTIYVVADDCDISSIKISDSRLTVLKPDLNLHSKIKSIDFAIENFREQHDTLIIFDSDNLVHPRFLMEINKLFNEGFKAVQARLLPKNQNTDFAILDGIGDAYYDFIDRKARTALGLSSHIYGLGIAIDLSLYNKITYESHLGGFDKKIQADIIRHGEKIGYTSQAIVYDEKIVDGQALTKQRSRWIHSYIKYFSEGIKLLLIGLKKVNLDIISFGIDLIRPPVFILLSISILLTVVNYLLGYNLLLTWVLSLSVFLFTFLAIVFIQKRDSLLWSKIWKLPIFGFYLFKALFGIKKAKKSFLKTDHHEVIYIDQILTNASLSR